MDSFCGKDCGLCAWKEQIACPGCREGLGKRFEGPCEIAACCREKGHEECGTCSYISGCPRRAGREDVPGRELQRRKAERDRQRELAEQAPLLGKWLWRLFWLTVPVQTVLLLGGFLPVDQWTALHPGLHWAGLLLRAAIGGAEGLFFWKLSPVREGYRKAALCQFAVTAASAATAFLPADLEQEWLLLPGLAIFGVGLYRDYQEFHAHAGVLENVDGGLAGEWRRLWKWTVKVFGGLVLGVFLPAILGVLGLLLLLALLVGLIALIVLKMVYLWRTVKIFRDFRQPPALPE